mgnify:CR=1 FL=1
MASINLPPVLTPQQWEKQKGVLAKPTGISDALKALQRASTAVDRGAAPASRSSATILS